MLSDRYKVQELGVFGSYVRQEQHDESDLDILVTFSETPPLIEVHRARKLSERCFQSAQVGPGNERCAQAGNRQTNSRGSDAGMNEQHTYIDYVKDTLEAIEGRQFIEGMGYDEFSRDDKTVYAAIRALEIVGEA